MLDKAIVINPDFETHRVADLGGAELEGLFANPHQNVNLGDEVISCRVPTFTVWTADLAALTWQRNSTVLTLAEGSFTIVDSQPDGVALTVMILTEA